ncbi:hypothetical protein R1sor_005133 [Riccia sorocarpa]|uniref:RING-type domain-containing protein n=1 Tax=Riccia sorocarpa TaxID=122646 RepID=A0ABD3HM58_9MARC
MAEAAEAANMEEAREAVGEDEAEMDARIATIMHLQQLQHKEEVMQLMEAHPVTNADTEFRMELEELVRDHLNTCMALASCSTSHDTSTHTPAFASLRDNPGESHHRPLDLSPDQCHHHHHHHHQYLLVEADEAVNVEEERLERQQQLPGEGGDEMGVSDGLLRPQASVSDRWDERQDRQPSVRERQVREAELLALASLHTVSTMGASFVQPPPETGARNEAPEENPSVPRRQEPRSSLFRMWRELENERERERQRNSRGPRAQEVETEVAQMWEEYTRRQEEEEEEEEADLRSDPLSHVERVMSETNLQAWQNNQDDNGTDNETVQSVLIEPPQSGATNQETSGNAQVQEPERNQNGAQEAEGERERVRQIVHRYTRESGVSDSEVRSDTRPSSRTEWLREDERERVREMTREWARVSSIESRDASPQRQFTPSSSPPEQSPTSQGTFHGPSSVAGEPSQHAEDSERRILKVLIRAEQERRRELEGLSEHRSVSEFAHRRQLQYLLRGRYFRNAAPLVEYRPPSSAAGEIGQLRQRRAVSGLREGFRFRLENIIRQANPQQDGTQGVDRRTQANQQVVSAAAAATAAVPSRATPRDANAVRRNLAAVGAGRRATALQSLEDATAYNMELRELISRRSVSTMLASEFRERLDELIRSFIHRQGRTPQPWNVNRPTQAAPGQEEQPEVDADGRDGVAQAVPIFIPPPPPPPPLPLWQRPLARVQPELETTSRSLHADVTDLKRDMKELREMMDTCIQMQLELQRSIRQEVSGALHQMYMGKPIPDEALDGAKWTSVKKGTCCVCCDKAIDALLYRCGHMSTCLNCAMELHRNRERCPLCRAAIVEVVRAFTVA